MKQIVDSFEEVNKIRTPLARLTNRKEGHTLMKQSLSSTDRRHRR